MCIKISVIIPVFNCAKTLQTCLKSIIAQTLKDIEIICINDGSTDDSLEILNNFAKKDKRIKIVNKIKEGYGAALNIGLNLARGEYEAIIEPRDFIDKKMFEKLYARAKTSEADIVKSAYYKLFKDINSQKPVKTFWEKKYQIPSWYFRICECPALLSLNPSVWSCIYKKTFLNNNSIRFVQAPDKSFTDNPFQVETMVCAQKIVYTSAAYYYRCESISKNIILQPNNLDAPFERCEEMLQILSSQKVKDKNIYANIYKRILWHVQNVLNVAVAAPDFFIDIASGFFDEGVLNFSAKTIPYEIQLRIESLISKFEESIIENNSYINDAERKLFKSLLRVKAKGLL